VSGSSNDPTRICGYGRSEKIIGTADCSLVGRRLPSSPQPTTHPGRALKLAQQATLETRNAKHQSARPPAAHRARRRADIVESRLDDTGHRNAGPGPLPSVSGDLRLGADTRQLPLSAVYIGGPQPDDHAAAAL
jgi:hypothetical protein